MREITEWITFHSRYVAAYAMIVHPQGDTMRRKLHHDDTVPHGIDRMVDVTTYYPIFFTRD